MTDESRPISAPAHPTDPPASTDDQSPGHPLIRVFSPSATSDFLLCPLYWHLRRRGVQSRRLGKKGLAGILGTAFSAGVGAYNHARREGVVITPSRVTDFAEIGATIARQHLTEAKDAGLEITGLDVATAASLEKRCKAAVTFFAAHDPIPSSWEVKDVELTMDEAGFCRLDVAYLMPIGDLAVVDYKTKVTYNSDWLVRDAAQFRDSEQAFHYSYWYGRRMNLPVAQFGVLINVLEPRPHIVEPIWKMNNQSTLDHWYRARLMTWSRMEASLGLELGDQEMAAEHHTKFGPCEFRGICLDNQGDLDLSLISDEFVVVDRSTK